MLASKGGSRHAAKQDVHEGSRRENGRVGKGSSSNSRESKRERKATPLEILVLH